MRSNTLYTAGSIVALLVLLTMFFSIRPEGFLRRGEAAATQAEVEAAGAAVPAAIPRPPPARCG